MELVEHTTKEHLRREEAAIRLRAIADELSRHNGLAFVREGVEHTVAVPDDVVFELEIEVGETKSEIEMTVSWRAT